MSWLTATEALRVLGVRPQTLYANVSRSKIRAKPDPKDTRRSLYHEADVRKMARQHGGQRKATAVAAAAIEWGDPILSSSVSTVVEGRLYYRGQDAAVLAETKTLEEVALLLWAAEAATGLIFESVTRLPATGAAAAVTSPAGSRSASPLQRAFLALGSRAGIDLSSHGRALTVLQAEAASVLGTLARSMLDSPRRGRHRCRGSSAHATRSRNKVPLHEKIASGWRRPKAADLIRRVLVLAADHELNASTFATRVAVSTGAPLSAGVLSGLATLSGPLHGRASLGVLELVAAAQRLGTGVIVRDWLSQGRAFAGFGHPLYPLGDPRAVALLQQFALPAQYAELREAVEEAIGEQPNIDFALAALTSVYALPQEAPLVLFALGRCAGWLAHALEQVTTGHPIRPRAHYVGPLPAS
jgi:citrate synthase